jgi:hypothetical protein
MVLVWLVISQFANLVFDAASSRTLAYEAAIDRYLVGRGLIDAERGSRPR